MALDLGALALRITADDSQARRAFVGTERSAIASGLRAGRGYGHSLAVGVGVGLVAVGAAVAKFGLSSVNAYVEAQTAQVRLQDAFAKFPKLADTNIASLRSLNTQLALKTKYDDDATASGQAVLAQFGLTGKQLAELTPLLQDYASKTGKDLPAAAGVLGKAFLGNTRALKAIGIDYKMTGNRAVDFANIQRLVNEKVGGFAEKEGKSAAGQAAILRNQFGELQEAAGQQLLPALLGLGRGLLRIVGFVQDNSEVFGTFGGVVKTVFTSIASAFTGGESSFRSFSDFVSTHQADITSAIITGGKAFVAFGLVLARVVSGGLRGFGAFADGIGFAVADILEGLATVAHGAALAWGWVPGLGAKLKESDAKFAAFATHAAANVHKTGDAARGLADGIDNKLIPGLHAAGRGLVDMGNKAITTAHARDIVARAEINHRNALDAATAAAKANGRTLDKNTVSGRANRAALTNLVGTSQAYIQKLIDTNASSKRVTAATKTAKEEFIRVAEKMGVSATKAHKLADEYFHIPKKSEHKHTQPGMPKAIESVKELNRRIDGMKNKTVKLSMTFAASATAAAVKFFKSVPGSQASGFVGAFQPHAAGGPIQNLSGHGAKGKDTELIAGAVDEHVWTDKEVAAAGGHGAMYRMRKAALRGELKGYVGGGPINRTVKINTNSNAVPSAVNKFVPAGVAAASDMGGDATRALGADGRAYIAGLIKAEAARQAAKAAAASSASTFHGKLPGGTGAAGIRAIARALGASYIAHHIDPQGGNAYDLGSSGARNRRIGNALVSAHGRLGLRYVIRQMQIASARSGWNWRGYHPITGSGDFRHVNHVHVSYANGTLGARRGIANVAERGYELVVNPQLRRFKGGERVYDHKDTKRMLGGDWSGSPLIGQFTQNFPQSLDPIVAANIAGADTVARLSAVGIG